MSQETTNAHTRESSLETIQYRLVHDTTPLSVVFAVCMTLSIFGQDQEPDRFIEIDRDRFAFPDLELSRETSKSLSTLKNDWVFTVSREPDRQVLRAESGERLVTQTITRNAVHKRFVFDLKRQRFEPMRQEIRIERADEGALRHIEEMTGVSRVKRYENLGISIVTIDVDVNPIEVLRTLKDQFAPIEARILTGFFDDEPM
ncbi:MAG: hypothetical protein OXG05_00490 [Gammaproteobacteria bacterium]|nr:hypothetical protein [Gammaproteobacteria bacterium]